jgi:hypothetical protein
MGVVLFHGPEIGLCVVLLGFRISFVRGHMTNNYVKAVVFGKRDHDSKRKVEQETIAFFDATSQESIERAKDVIGNAPGELSIYRVMPLAFPGVPKIGEQTEAAS